ncbi:hypothetical protein IG604_23525, partial [Vibrio cholerae]|nr:hypothetical protein [Vibrio cholerae]
TTEGKIVLSASHDEQYLTLSVRDTGPGIEPDMLATIFEPLVQAGQQHSAGLGLGLSISRQLVELMHGSLSVHSEPLVGSTFSFRLPLATADATTQSAR